MNLPKMVDSDKSDNGESQTTAKRLREDNSGDEKIELPSKRPRSKSPDTTDTVDNKKDIPVVQVTNGSAVPSDKQTNAKGDDELKNGQADASDDDAKTPKVERDDIAEMKMEVGEPLEKPKEDIIKEENEKIDEKTEEEVKKGDKKPEVKNEPLKEDKSKDSEVVDGLELSVECASDKDASSSESEKEKDSQPRPKTIIVKAKPNDSELEVGSSEAEKSHEEEKEVENDTVNNKRAGKRKAVGKTSSSPSEESLESNSDDEDYSPRTKKKLKKAAATKKVTPKTKPKRVRETKKKQETDSEDDKSESEDEEMNLADRAKKIAVSTESKTKDEKNDSESGSLDEDESASESDDKTKKNGRRKSETRYPKDNKTIKKLKRYVTTAGIHVRYSNLWAGCKSNRQKIDRIKKLLKENGIEGTPTLEKCKRAQVKNAIKEEVVELDTSNIISEGRVTRARRLEANKATKDREVPNILKRIQPVCDSDTE